MDKYHYIYDKQTKQYVPLISQQGGSILKQYIRLYKFAKQQTGGFVELSQMKNAQYKELSQGDQCILTQGKIDTPPQQDLSDYMSKYNNLTAFGEPNYDVSGGE